MSSKAERRTIQEHIGRAVNANTLRTEGRAPGAETALLQVAAFGAAQLHVHHGADRRHQPIATVVSTPGHVPDEQDVLVSELSGLLWHIRYGGQHGFVPRATLLFALWMSHRGRFGAMVAEERAPLLHRLSVQAMHEWLSDRCIACGGSGKLERSASGSWIRPRGSMQRNATFRTCPGCDGSRRQAVSHTRRAVALGIDRKRYDDERWDAHCKAALTWLDKQLAKRPNRPLAAQLERTNAKPLDTAKDRE